jgi:tetratricopeptide (TPR) repeat protein
MKETTKIALCQVLFIASLSVPAFGESTAEKEKPVVDSPDSAVKTEDHGNLEKLHKSSLTDPKVDQLSEGAKLFAILDKADAYFKKGDFKNTLIEYDRFLENHPTNLDSYSSPYKGTNKKYCETAVLNLQAMLKNDSLDKWKICDLLGFFCARQGEFDLAFEYYKESEEIKPGSCDPKFEIAKHYFFQRKIDKAIVLLREVTNDNPSNIKSWQLLSFAAFFLNLPEESEKAFAKAVELDPKNIQNIRSYVFVTFMTNRVNPDRTIKNLNLVISNDPKDIEALKIRAYCYFVKKDYDAAIEDLTSALKVDPNNLFCLKKRGKLLCEFKKEYKKALEDLSQALKMANEENEPDDEFISDAHVQLSEVYSKLGNEKKSLIHAKMSYFIKNRSSQDKADFPK